MNPRVPTCWLVVKAPTPKVTVMTSGFCVPAPPGASGGLSFNPTDGAVPHDGGETKVQRQGPALRLGSIWAGLCHCLPVGLQTECSLSLCFGLCPSKGPTAAVLGGAGLAPAVLSHLCVLGRVPGLAQHVACPGRTGEGAGRPPGPAVSPSPPRSLRPWTGARSPSPPGLGASWKAGPGPGGATCSG